MTEFSLPWDDGGGDGGPYTSAQWTALWARLYNNADPDAGVFKGAQSEYMASGALSPVVVQPGNAMVDGTYAYSTANVNVVVSTPAVATRVDRIVLRKTFADKEVRLALVQGAEGGGAPALTQTAGIVWEIPLWQISTTTGGVITFTADERIYLQYATEETIPVQAGGRLTLTSGTPVTTSDVLAAGTLYYTPWKSDKVPVFVNGVLRNLTFTELSYDLATPGSTANTLYDIFVKVGFGGTLALEALAWAVSTAGASARATALAYHEGVRVKDGDISRTYLGTIRITSVANQCEDSAKARYVWNYYNQVPRTLRAVIAADTWTYATNTWRAQNADTTLGSGMVGLVLGLQEGALVEAINLNGIQVDYGNVGYAAGGIGLNSAVADSSSVRSSVRRLAADVGTDDEKISMSAEYRGYPPVGFNTVQRIENASPATSTITFQGDQTNVNAAYNLPGLTGAVMG